MERKKTSKVGDLLLKYAIPSSGMLKRDFAESLGISGAHLRYIISGDRRVTWKTAKRLGDLTDKPAREWLALQADADLAEGEGQAESR